MIRQYLSNTNEKTTVSILQNILELNKASALARPFRIRLRLTTRPRRRPPPKGAEQDVLPHRAGAEHAAAPAALRAAPPRQARLQAHQGCRGHLQVGFPIPFLNLARATGWRAWAALRWHAGFSRSCLAVGGTGSLWRSRVWRTSARGSSEKARDTSPSPSSTSASSSDPSRAKSSRLSSPWWTRWGGYLPPAPACTCFVRIGCELLC